MTQEEKAARYDEVIKVANKYKDTHIMFPQIKDEIFPELAESDDERMRKALIDYFRWNPNSQLLNEFTNREVFAWLEKQGEQKLYINDNAKEMFIKALERVEEQNNKGYKLTDCDKNSWWKDFKAYTSCTIEQNPAEWSEEDEENFKHLMDEIVCLGNSRNSANRLYYDRLIKFLGELKDRAQPREEWCETDERKLDRLIAYFEDRVAFTDKDDLEYAEWLKSLRPQSQWKPSDAQMEALKGVQEGVFRLGILESLYNDLKNLK